MNLEVGSKAPDFCLPSESGEEICLKDLKGKWVILYFYPKDNTPGCTKEALAFSELIEDFKKLNAVILGVSADSVDSHRKFKEKKGLKVTLLSDETKETIKAYGAWQLKKMYGREFYGIVRSTFLINPEGKISHIWKKIRVKGHAEDVLSKLKELSEEK